MTHNHSCIKELAKVVDGFVLNPGDNREFPCHKLRIESYGDESYLVLVFPLSEIK